MPLYDYRCTQCGHTFEVSHHVGGVGRSVPGLRRSDEADLFVHRSDLQRIGFPHHRLPQIPIIRRLRTRRR
ncbi:MAG: hypothetical protein HYU43_03135 [Armatimonadetes bacterium]|nr:hypothetical protein [Armatimonadota bacterium]